MSKSKRGLTWLGLFLLCSLICSDVVLADPPVNPPPCNVRLYPLFCYSVTQQQGDAAVTNTFSIMLEVLNWTGSDAAGVNFSVAAAGIQVGNLPYVVSASVDANGRPFGPDFSTAFGQSGSQQRLHGRAADGDEGPVRNGGSGVPDRSIRRSPGTVAGFPVSPSTVCSIPISRRRPPSRSASPP